MKKDCLVFVGRLNREAPYFSAQACWRTSDAPSRSARRLRQDRAL